MKKIAAYLLGVCYETEVDDEDYEFLSQYRWTAKVANKTVYARANVEYQGEWYNIEMHRMVIGDAVDAIDELETPYREVRLGNGKIVFVVRAGFGRRRKKSVDHIDGNGLNNCRQNLRHATCSEQVKKTILKG